MNINTTVRRRAKLPPILALIIIPLPVPLSSTSDVVGETDISGFEGKLLDNRIGIAVGVKVGNPDIVGVDVGDLDIVGAGVGVAVLIL